MYLPIKLNMNLINLKTIIILNAITIFSKCDTWNNEIEQQQDVNQKVKDEIATYAPFVQKLINVTVKGEFKGSTYNYLATFIDKFGNRLAGTTNLENAIDYMLQKSNELKLENVHGENVEVPHWVRGNESATLLQPRYQNLAMLGLGSSVGTPPEGIEAEAFVVTSFKDLGEQAYKAKGKIVVFNPNWISYGATVKYRTIGASVASRYGAVAVLIRSVTPFSINSPHTGEQFYQQNVTKIPSACITIADANMLKRMQDRGDKLVIKIKMEAKTLDPAISRNTVVEIVGHEKPEQVVVISGHLDSWDVGQGAMDDGGGAFLAWSSLVLIKQLGLRPRRTLRAILWTAEEEGMVGSSAYVAQHKNETKNFNFVMESDMGTFKPQGLKFTGLPEAQNIVSLILRLFEEINTTRLESPADGAPDCEEWFSLGVPGASLLNANERYFWFHHSDGDTMDVENSEDLDKATALWAGVAYIIADLSYDIPKKLNISVL